MIISSLSINFHVWMIVSSFSFSPEYFYAWNEVWMIISSLSINFHAWNEAWMIISSSLLLFSLFLSRNFHLYSLLFSPLSRNFRLSSLLSSSLSLF